MYLRIELEFLPNKYFYTSLMQAYVKTRNPTMAFKILQEMEECDITPDLPVYTTLINCFRQGRCLDKCWEVNRRLIRKKVPLDETYVGVMLKVHAAVSSS